MASEVSWRLDALKCWAGDAAAMVSQGGSSSSGGLMEVAAVRDGGLDAAWASNRLFARLARSSSSEDAKLVMAEWTGVGRCCSHRVKRKLIFAEVPVSSGGRRQRDLISVRASDGFWSLSSWLDRSRIIWTLRSAEGENFCRRNALRSSRQAKRTFVGRLCLGWRRGCDQPWYGSNSLSEGGIVLRPRRNHIAAHTVENVGSLKCRTLAGEVLVVVARCREPVVASGTSSVGAAGTSSSGMAKAKASNSGVANVTTVDLL